MGKRATQAAHPSQPKARKKNRSLVSMLIRVLLVVVLVLVVVFLMGGWYYSGEIRSGALEPPTAVPEAFDWQVTESGASVTLTASPGTNQEGEYGRSGLMWANGYAHSLDLISSTEVNGSAVDVRSMVPGEQAPVADTDVKVDAYYWRGDPMTAHDLPFETVFYTSDIGPFPAWYIEPESSTGPNADTWAIVVHGKGGTLEESLRIIPVLHERGHPILVIKYRNDVGEAHDPSGYYQYGQTEWVDLAAAVTYARDQGAAGHILVGYSYGGSVIAGYLTQSPLRNFTKATILDSPVLSFEDSVDFRASQAKVPLLGFTVPESLTSFAKWIATWRFDIDWEATDYLTQTANIHSPMLIFHGTQDTSVPYATSRAMVTNRPDITTLVTTEAAHTRSWNIDDAAFDAAVLEFLDSLD
jgi:hypothetical protein